MSLDWLSGKVVLVTGGAGSLGTCLSEALANKCVVRVFDNDEYGLYKLQRMLKDKNHRFLLGDVRDRERVKLALDGVDYVIHAAAAKNIEITEYNVPEAIRTNVEGTINLIEIALVKKVKKFLYVSSDKAVEGTTLYGATKFVGEKTVMWASRISKNKYSIFRPGNFIEARGNVFEIWKEQTLKGYPITITDEEARRYYLPTKKAANLCVSALESMRGGEIFVPKAQEYSMMDLARKAHPGQEIKQVGLRYKEKLREELMTIDEWKNAKDVGEMWMIKER